MVESETLRTKIGCGKDGSIPSELELIAKGATHALEIISFIFLVYILKPRRPLLVPVNPSGIMVIPNGLDARHEVNMNHSRLDV